MFRTVLAALISVTLAPQTTPPPSSPASLPQDAPMPAPAHPATRPAHPAPAPADAKPNRLIRESSPYLLQHAHNPVDWYPWGDEAFKAARERDKPIFLSIGYSTCYWCHVMERECFENADIAAIMNEHFICIKVDREQRPDVDDIYMTAVQLLTGSGGWPMSMFLEPKTLKPFFGGTYFPPDDAFGRPGFPTVLQQVAGAWTSNRAAVLAQADQVAQAVIAQHSVAPQAVELSRKQVDDAIAALMSSYDSIDGGFGGGARRAPKFPMPANLDLLMNAAWDQKSPHDAVAFTLDRMATGGMYDQVGGGFHRYSTDEKWLVPHFEKMLYDNAQLAATYARAYELTHDEFDAQIVRETLDYVLREMTSKDGGFFSAQDAEVNALEGGNYLWTAEEVRQTLEAAGLRDDVNFALQVYGLDKGPNFEDPHHPEAGKKNVLFLSQRPDKLAAALKIKPDEFNARLGRINQALLAARNKRDQPATDDKILAGWNGLMIAGFAEGGRVLKEPKYLDAAKKAAEFVQAKMRAQDGGLMRSFRDGKPQIDAFLEDYAFVIHGLLALNRATGEKRWLDEAVKLANAARERFWDASSGGFFDTRDGQSDLFVRIKSVYDGAVPSGNSIMLLNLLDLHERTHDVRWLNDAKAAMTALSSAIDQHVSGCVLSVLALHRFSQIKSPPAAAAAPPPVPPSATPSLPSTGAPSGAGYGASGEKITATINPKEVTVKPGAPANFEITIEIVKGWHINTNAPGDQFAVPLKIELTGCEGLKMTPKYPPGEAFKAGGADAAVQVYAGKITVPVTLEQTGKFSGQPRISLAYQACNDRVCLDPKRIMLGLRILAQK